MIKYLSVLCQGMLHTRKKKKRRRNEIKYIICSIIVGKRNMGCMYVYNYNAIEIFMNSFFLNVLKWKSLLSKTHLSSRNKIVPSSFSFFFCTNMIDILCMSHNISHIYTVHLFKCNYTIKTTKSCLVHDFFFVRGIHFL